MLNPYQQYKNTSIYTMTKGELLVLLYDEMIKRLNHGKILMENGSYEEANNNFKKCRKILSHLTATLDSNFEFYDDLVSIYSFLSREIIKASSLKNIGVVDEILPLIRELRDTWAEADKIARISKA
jgi:flagellar protein FliS